MSLRGFQVLATVTALFTVAALWAVLTDLEAVSPQSQPHRAFPDLEERQAAVRNILITGKDNVVHLRLDTSWPLSAEDQAENVADRAEPWRVSSSDGYPADQAAVARLLSGMETLIFVDARTTRPERFSLLKLDAPADGNGAVGIALQDREEAMIAGLILGSTVEPPTPDRPGKLYARKEGELQTWLAEGRIAASPAAKSWLDQNMRLPADRDIRSIGITPAEGPDYAMDRERPQAGLVFRSLPDGRRLANPSAPMQLAQSLAFLTIEDARGRPQEPPIPEATAAFGTFDGRRLILKQWTEAGQPWMIIDLEGDWNGDLSDRARGYMFRLSPLRARSLFGPLETLLIPPG